MNIKHLPIKAILIIVMVFVVGRFTVQRTQEAGFEWFSNANIPDTSQDTNIGLPRLPDNASRRIVETTPPIVVSVSGQPIAPNDVGSDSSVKKVLQNVPFVSQAPFGDWGDPRQQDGCEEISALMAMAWVRGETLSRKQALEKLFAISEYEETTYGSYHDTSAKDTVQRIFNEYFEYQNVEVIESVTEEAIKRELMLGNLVITPMDGQLLNNPYYSPPGPERHMVVVIGYDPATDEFITNDPGTRRGEGYRYDASDFVNAIRDYPTGYHAPISPSSRSAMIVVRK